MPTVWVATSDGLIVIDTIAVARAMAGNRHGWNLTRDETHYTARLMLERGDVPYSTVAERIGVSCDTLRKWFPSSVPPARPTQPRPSKVLCGTVGGYRKHRRTGTNPCQRCKAAYTEADRHYRRTGTYRGAPEYTTGTAA
ncbi:hypothetical protein AOB60_43035 [Streptomyces noursei]|uniref:Uncharacterized protein n=2 Tax=Actinomycetota TaxID=201174 RepID=A0A2N8P431_STRNR|nr:hypothetical protein AOB60_43035 [Streptomyces noursei]